MISRAQGPVPAAPATNHERPGEETVSATTTAATRDGKGSRGRVLWWLAALVLAGTVGLGAVLGARLGTDPTLVDSPLIGKPAPNVAWPYLEKEGVLRLADLRGEVVVVNFWASWCVSCREEHPDLMAAANAYADAGVTFVGVNFQDQKASAVAYLDELGRGEHFDYVVDSGSLGAVDFGVYGVPETFVIDREGTIVAKITGAATFPLLARTLDQVLAGQTPGETSNGPVQRAPGG